MVVKVLGRDLELLVADPEDDVPADQPQAGGFESSVEGHGSLLSCCLTSAVENSSVLAAGTVHEPDSGIEESYGRSLVERRVLTLS